jgi:hypothetical protein
VKQNIPNIYVFAILSLIVLVFGYFIYNKTIGATNELISNYEQLNSQLEQNIDFEFEIDQTQSKIDEIDQVISLNKLDVGTIQNSILEKIKSNGKTKNIVVTKVPEPHVFTELQYDIVTNIVECNGNYREIVKLIHYFENEFPQAKLSSVDFEVRKNIKSKKRKLYAKLCFQNIQK